MSRAVPRSIHLVVTNLLTVLAQQGDPDAIAALQNTQDVEVYDDGNTSEGLKAIVQIDAGEFLITQKGVVFLPKESDKSVDE